MYRTDFDLCLLNNDKTGARRRQDGCWKDPGPNPIAGQALPESQQKNRHVPHQHCGMELLPASSGVMCSSGMRIQSHPNKR